MKYDVFISYSRKDNNTAKQICSVLENYARHYKFEYFFDQDDIICRDEYLKRISSAISESKAILFIASKNSYKSEFCAKELLFADKRGVRIHQYRIDDAEIPLDIDMLLGTHQYREAKSTSIENFVREVLADSLRCTIESLSSLKEKVRVEDERRREEQRAKRVEVIDSTIAKHNEELKSVDQHIIECEKSLLELKYRRDRLNVTLKELKDERLALLSFVSQSNNKNVDKTSWDVYMKSPGLAKLQVTKAIRDTMGLTTLSEASQIVYRTPCYVARNKSKSVATQIVKALVDAGAEVELR